MIDWQALVVTDTGRSAIYDEALPAVLDRAMVSAPDPEAVTAEVDQRFRRTWWLRSLGRGGHWAGVGELGRAQYMWLGAGRVLRFIAVEERR